MNLALLLLGTDHYAEGWREYEWRLSQGLSGLPPRPFTAPQWNGAPLSGASLLIHCEQGEGDTFHFIRYLPSIRSASAAGRVILECSPAVIRLLRSSPITAGCEIVERAGWSQDHLPAFDFHHPLLSSPQVLGMLEPFAPTGAYLSPAAFARRSEKELRVGLVWSANREHTKATYRSVPFPEMMKLAQIGGAQFVSLQYDRREALPPGIEDAAAGIRDFHATAEVLAGLDLIITVDTSVAHLAGALGHPVWTLLSHAPDWRWKRKGSTTPWYPTMRLFRQTTAGDWTSVLREVAQELPAFLTSG